LSFPHLEVVALWLIYAAAAAAALWLARRHAGPFPTLAGILLALAPLVFCGKAMLLGEVYGPADLYYGHDPWKNVAAEHGVGRMANPILSDLAFANLPWRAAVRESLVNGRHPFWNRFVLAGNPLLGAAQAAIFHPSTWLGIWLPLALSWTFSCAFTIFLALLSGFLFFFDFRIRPLAALVGAIGWGFSTYLVFFDGWSVGTALASFPLLLLGLRRIASGRANGVRLTIAALLLSLAGGHPEAFLHSAAAGGVYFLWEIAGHRRRFARAIGSAVLAGVLAFLLAGPQLFPLLEAIRNSAEYRSRQSALVSGASSQSVPVREAAARLLPAVLPFAHGIYGKSPVQEKRNDGSGMPLAYAGASLFALGIYGLLWRRKTPDTARGRVERGRSVFLAFFVAGLLFGASAPGLIDLVTRLPVFALALNYRLVFLAGLGLAGLAAFGTERVCRQESWGGLAAVSAVVLVSLTAIFFLSQGVFRERALPDSFVRTSLAWEVLPVALLGAAALLFARRRRGMLLSVLVLVAAQRAGEMFAVYPTLPAATLAPDLPQLAKLPAGGVWRIAAAGDVFRPNGAALYGLEDVRGYESLLLDRFADTFPLWSQPQAASFNRVDDLAKPFLSFLNVRFAIAPPAAAPPRGWREFSRGREMTIFENPKALPRAFAPRKIRFETDSAKTLSGMAAASDFSETAWVVSTDSGERDNGPAEIALSSAGQDLLVSVTAPGPVFVATSVPDWPGWSAKSGHRTIPLVRTDHAFIGFWLEAGRQTVRLRYRPFSFFYGLASFAAGLVAAAAFGLRSRRSSG
jgi:membrane protein YfhO